MVLEIQKQMPSGTMLSTPTSASVHVLRSRLSKIYPQSLTTFSYNESNQIILDVNSPSDFWDAQMSYLRMRVSVALSNDGNNDVNKYLSEGAVLSIFERFEIFTKSGTLIERIDGANVLHSMVQTVSMAPQQVEQQGAYNGDSVHPIDAWDCGMQSISLDPAAYTYTAATRSLGVLAGAGGVSVIVGSTVSFVAAGVIYKAEVQSVTDVNTVVLKLAQAFGELLPAGNLAAGAISEFTVIYRQKANRSVIANTAGAIVCFQPFSSFLSNGNLIPLFLMRGGLRIVLTLARPEYCVVSASRTLGAGFTAANVSVTQPEYICSFLTPDQALSEAYLSMFNSNKIHLFYTGFKTYRNIIAGGAATSASLSHNTNVRSAKFVMTRIQDSRARTVSAANIAEGASTFTCDSVAQGLSAGLRQYSLQSGSDIFPQQEPLDFGDPAAGLLNYSEAAVEVARVMSTLGSSVGTFKCAPDDWRESSIHRRYYESGGRTDSQRLVLGALLARDPSVFSGVDLSLNVLNESFVFGRAYNVAGAPGAAATDRYITSFLAYDQVVTIGSSGVIVQS